MTIALLNRPPFWQQKEENKAFAVGHFALGYLTSTLSAKAFKTKINLPIILTLSVIPDSDILTDIFHVPYLAHRGPIHSIVVLFIIFLPIFAVYRKRAIPYFLALIQHSLIGDYLTGTTQLLWPITTQYYGMNLSIRGLANTLAEWTAFITSIIAMTKTKDIIKFLQPHYSNLILSVPTVTVLLPTVLKFPLFVPVWLMPPHLFYLLLFSVSIVIALPRLFKSVFHVKNCL
jgi:membrane-bound metal-dependent hydrolase YbcI (DUF457 family)